MRNLLHLQVENVRVDIYTLRELQVTKSPKSRDKRRQWHALFRKEELGGNLWWHREISTFY